MRTSAPAPARVVVARDGLEIAALDWAVDSQATPLLLLHPNGFCAGLFDPLARILAAEGSCRPIGVDLRGHGATSKPADLAAYAFDEMARDVVAVLDALGIDDAVGLGQSLGGGVMVLVDGLRPGLLRRMLLCEAVAFPIERFIPTPNPMAAIARKRRMVWADRETMRASYSQRAPLGDLAPDALDAYLTWGVVDRDDGKVELACPPESEANVFEISSTPAGAIMAWDHLPDLTAEATVVVGDRTNLPAQYFASQAERARAALLTVDGGHFMVQESAARAAGWVVEHLLG